MLKYKTYAENIRMAGKTSENKLRRPIAIRELADAIGVTYETVRQLWMGPKKGRDGGKPKPLYVSRVTNDDICDYLGLPKDEMWALSQAEKFSRKTGYAPLRLIEDQEGREISDLWSSMDADQRQTVLRMVRSFAGENREQSAQPRGRGRRSTDRLEASM